MQDLAIREVIAQQEADRERVLNHSDAAQSALVLANMALEHGGSGAEAAARLLLSMQYARSFNFRYLTAFDATNRAHADLVIMRYTSHDLWPSRWLNAIGQDGNKIIEDIRDKWPEG